MSVGTTNKQRHKTDAVYALSWNKQLNFLLGWYSRYMAAREFYSAFGMLEVAIYHVVKDKRQRIFIIDRKEKTIDDKAKLRFEALFTKFKQLYGSEPNPKGKLSYLDLRILDKPDTLKDRVFISKRVRFSQVWNTYPPGYTNQKIGYAYSAQNGHGQIQVADMNDKVKPKMTNCIPYATWQDQSRKVFEMLLPVSKELETIVATYLHNEGETRTIVEAAMGVSMDYDNENQMVGAMEDDGGFGN